MIAMASSSKHIAQILALLTERGLSFSFCLNKEELLVLSGFSLLMQGLDLQEGSKVLKDNQKTLALIIGQLDRMKASAASRFRHVVCACLPNTARRSSSNPSSSSSSRHGSEGSMPAPHHSTIPAAMKQQFKAMTQKFWPDKSNDANMLQRRMTSAGPYRHSSYAQSVPALSPGEGAHMPRSEPARSPPGTNSLLGTPGHRQSVPPAQTQPSQTKHPRASLNLDYLSFNSSGTSTPTVPAPAKNNNQTDWERLLANLDNGQTNIFDNIYGGPPVEVLQEPQKQNQIHNMQSVSTSNLYDDTLGWDPEIWAVTAGDPTPVNTAPTITESVASSSSNDESRGSGSGPMLGFEDIGNVDELESYGGLLMPEVAHSDDGFWEDRLDHSFAMA